MQRTLHLGSTLGVNMSDILIYLHTPIDPKWMTPSVTSDHWLFDPRAISARAPRRGIWRSLVLARSVRLDGRIWIDKGIQTYGSVVEIFTNS
jgi:hypothetical protein